LSDKPATPAVPRQHPATTGQAAPTFSLPRLLEELLKQAEVSQRETTIPRALTTAERSTLSQIATEADMWANVKPEVPTMLETVARLLLAFPTANMSEAIAAARKDAYQVALEDVPTWAVAAAGKRWVRGDVAILGDKVNLSFPPSPPQLRLLALDEVANVRGAGIRAKKLLNAKVRKEISPEERARVLKKIRQSFPSAPAKAASMDEPRDLTADERRIRLAEMAQAVVDDMTGSV